MTEEIYDPNQDVHGGQGDQLPEQSPTQEPEQREQPQIDERVAQQAEQLGLSEEEIGRLGPEMVSQIVDRAESLAFQRFRSMGGQQQPPPQEWQQQQVPPWQRQQGPQQQWPQQQWPQQSPQNWQQQGQQPPPGSQAPNGPFKIDLDTNIYDPGLVDVLNQMNEHYQNTINQMQQALQDTHASVSAYEEQQHAEFSAWFDRALTGLGDEFATVFGRGSINQLFEGSPEAQARLQAYQAYSDYLRFTNQPPNTRDDAALSRVVRMTRGGPSDYQKQLSNQIRQRGKQTIGKPTSTRRNDSEDSQRDPLTGVSRSTVNDIQRMIDEMQAAG